MGVGYFDEGAERQAAMCRCHAFRVGEFAVGGELPEYTEAIPDWQKPELEKIAEQARHDAANKMRRPFKAIMIPLDC